MKTMDVEKDMEVMGTETVVEDIKTNRYLRRKYLARRAACARVHREAAASGCDTGYYECEGGYSLLMTADEAAWNHERTLQFEEEVRRLDDLSNWDPDPYFNSQQDDNYWVGYRDVDDYDDDEDYIDDDDSDIDPYILHRYHLCDYED